MSNKEVKNILTNYDRLSKKMDEFGEFLKKKDKEFKLQELEDSAIKLIPNLKKIQ